MSSISLKAIRLKLLISGFCLRTFCFLTILITYRVELEHKIGQVVTNFICDGVRRLLGKEKAS